MMADIALPVALDDKYRREQGRIFLTGTQALVRAALRQADRDRAGGLRTGGFVSGYRGSPLAALDKEFGAASKLLRDRRIEVKPAVNEELGASAVWGSQQVGLFPGSEVDGVFGVWYGKGAGLDRAGDAIRHGNSAGSSLNGGVLVAVGDDHVAKSSSQTHSCEAACADLALPLLYPADVQEVLDLALHGLALSRHSGSWVAIKITPEVGDSTQSVEADDVSRVRPALPSVDRPADGLHIRWPDTAVEQERRQQRYRLPAAQAYVRANGLDRTVGDRTGARTGLVSAGKSWLDLLEALRLLGIDEPAARRLGLVLYKVAMPWPLEPEGFASFADGLERLVFVEEKRPVMESQAKDMLFDRPPGRRPRIAGKLGFDGNALFPRDGDLSPERIALALGRTIPELGADAGVADRLRALDAAVAQVGAIAPPPTLRKPFFCSGCPHNRSTKLPDGSRALAGIGCHAMSMWMDRDTATWSQMGGEGVPWIGQAPFTSEKHVFANLGDGTYFHSGSLAVRQAVASGANITFKILFNDAVAMTGGQSVDGTLSVPSLVAQLRAEGVERVTVVTDDVAKYREARVVLPPDVPVEPRSELDRVQREKRELKGTSVIVYDQACAAEKRRRRKRGRLADPQRRVVINDLVCEGCGDCSVKSNCLSVEPLDTPLGTKRRINQATCNKDYSCTDGFCPSFVTVEGGGAAGPSRDAPREPDGLPEPPRRVLPEGRVFRMVVAGVGGTGIVTIGALLGMAAHIRGLRLGILDQTGLAQKGGAVVSYLTLAAGGAEIASLKTPTGCADLLIACDPVVASGGDVLATVASGATAVLINENVSITGDFTRDPGARPIASLLSRRIRARAGEAAVDAAGFGDLAERLVGDGVGANLMMVGFALQRGHIPLDAEAVEDAIRINGAAVELNLRAFRWGRKLASDPGAAEPSAVPRTASAAEGPDAVVARRVAFLTAYQDRAYADRFRRRVERFREAETRLDLGSELSTAVARSLFKLMAYKDEYEVARLYTEGTFRKSLQGTFPGDARLTFHLAPPILARRDPRTGHAKKSEFGPWVMQAFRLLAPLKILRGTPFDPFGRTEERRTERRLITEFEGLLDEILRSVTRENAERATALVANVESIRGFGHVKQASLVAAKARETELLAEFRAHGRPPRLIAAE